MTRVRMLGGLATLVVLALLMVGFVFGGSRSLVDWRELRPVVFESDDWGLAGFAPDTAAWAGIDRTGLAPGRFPAIYWNSTLEDSADVAALAAVLAGARGRDGLPAVLQPNYIMGSQWCEAERWQAVRLPALPPRYERPGLWAAVDAARAAGVWRPELHGSWHYDPARRRVQALADANARLATDRGVLLFPGSEKAWELGPWRSENDLDRELTEAAAAFATVFRRPVSSVIAPDYTWDRRVEALWARHGLRVIQAKREQRHATPLRGTPGRVLKTLGRRWDAVAHPDRIYLERNCRFEPAQEPDPAGLPARCAAEVRKAWDRGEPAIVETHRVNFVHLDPAVPAAGRAALTELLATLVPDGPVFLTDTEVAQLARRGVSARHVPGLGTVLRNGTHSRRLIAVPGPDPDHPGVVALSAGATALYREASGGRRLVPLP